MIRGLIRLTCFAVLIFAGATVPLGKRTFFGHVRNIWGSHEAQDLVEGVKESSKPVVERVERGVEAAMDDEVAAEDDLRNP